MSRITEYRRIRREDLRRLCAIKKWYTRGGNEKYTKLLDRAHGIEDVTTAHIVAIADNIMAHSEIDPYEYNLASVCFEIGLICKSYFHDSEV